MLSSIEKLLLSNTHRKLCVKHLLGTSGMQAQSSDDINIYAVGHAPRSAAAMSMTRVGCGQTGAAVKLCLSECRRNIPRKRKPRAFRKTNPYVLGYRSSMRHEQVKTPACPVLIDRLTHAITCFGVNSELSVHLKTLHTSPCRGDKCHEVRRLLMI